MKITNMDIYGGMTLDEAIDHLFKEINTMECGECRNEHVQLRQWLIELKEYRENTI